MKCWHLRIGRPIGPTFDCRLTQPPPFTDEEHDACPYGMVWEETTVEKVAEEFARLVEYMSEHAPSYFPFQMKVSIK